MVKDSGNITKSFHVSTLIVSDVYNFAAAARFFEKEKIKFPNMFQDQIYLLGLPVKVRKGKKSKLKVHVRFALITRMHKTIKKLNIFQK